MSDQPIRPTPPPPPPVPQQQHSQQPHAQPPHAHPTQPQLLRAPVAPLAPGQKPAGSAVPNVKVPIHDTTSIEMVDEKEAHIGTKIRAYGVAESISRQTQFKRPTNVTHTGSVRVRSFHGRLSDEGLAFMDEKINQWLDEHPDIEIKTVTTAVGPYEGKIKEPCLIVNVWF